MMYSDRAMFFQQSTPLASFIGGGREPASMPMPSLEARGGFSMGFGGFNPFMGAFGSPYGGGFNPYASFANQMPALPPPMAQAPAPSPAPAQAAGELMATSQGPSSMPVAGFNPMMGGGFNPYMGGGFNPYMGGGFNPYMGGGFNPMMGGGFNPMMGGGFNPYMGGGFNPYMGGGFPSMMGGGFNPYMGGGFNPMMGGGFNQPAPQPPAQLLGLQRMAVRADDPALTNPSGNPFRTSTYNPSEYAVMRELAEEHGISAPTMTMEEPTGPSNYPSRAVEFYKEQLGAKNISFDEAALSPYRQRVTERLAEDWDKRKREGLVIM